MRFLLKQSSSTVAAHSQAKQILKSASKAIASSGGLPVVTPTTSSSSTEEEENTSSTSGKAWGQQCSPNCGCVLRIEAQLSECASKSSPTIVQASYHAKRVMATIVRPNKNGSSNNDANNTTTTTTTTSTAHHFLKPLTTTQRETTTTSSHRPILTSCTCPTLHHLAQQTVNHLPGKTLAQMRNEIDMGMVGSRSSVAFRHTVLRENVLPAIASSSSLKFDALRANNDIDGDDDDGNVNVDDDDDNGVRVMNSITHRHGHCYDLLEDSLLSMIHERIPPAPRTDSYAESYSPTLGRYFRMYSHSGRNIRKEEQDESDDDAVYMRQEGIELSSFHDMGDWQQQRKSPSSFFLFGDNDDASNNGPTTTITSNESLNIGSMFLQHVKESISNRLIGGDDDAEIFKRDKTTVKERANIGSSSSSEEEWDRHRRPPTTYLQLFDMYGDAHDASSLDDEVKDEPAMDDWLVYVDRIHSRESRSTIG